MTPTAELDRRRIELLYEYDAERYLRSLPLEHFMEAPPQATQRQITVNSLEAVGRVRPEVQVFSELLIQYPVPGEDPDEPARVVPDNMVVVHPARLTLRRSFMRQLQPVGPFLVCEYVSNENRRKDYDESYKKYEQGLAVPYYLLFYPDGEELTLFRLDAGRYKSVLPNADGRLAVPELELEVALLNGWVRYWFRGVLVPLPADLEVRLAAAERRADAETARADAETARAEAERQRAEAERQRAEAERQRADAEAARAAAGDAEIARLRALLADRGA